MLNFYVLSIFPTCINEIMLGCRQMSFGWLQIRVITRRVSSKEILCIKVIVSIPKDCMIALLSQRNNLSLFSEFINRQFAHCWGIMLRITTHTECDNYMSVLFSQVIFRSLLIRTSEVPDGGKSSLIWIKFIVSNVELTRKRLFIKVIFTVHKSNHSIIVDVLCFK